MLVSTTVVSTRNCLPSSRPSWTAACTTSLVDGFQGGRGEPVEGAVESIVPGNGVAVEIGKAAQGKAIVDAFAQLAIIPVLDAHENQRAQGLRGGNAVAPGVGVLQSTLQILAHVLDQRGMVVQEVSDALQRGIEVDTLVPQFEIGEAELGDGKAAHSSSPGAAVRRLISQMRSKVVFEFVVVAQPLLDDRLLFGGEADLFGASARIADGQDPDGMAVSLGADGAAGAMADEAVEQGAAEDLGGEGRAAASLARLRRSTVLIHLYNETLKMKILSSTATFSSDFVFFRSHDNRAEIGGPRVRRAQIEACNSRVWPCNNN